MGGLFRYSNFDLMFVKSKIIVGNYEMSFDLFRND